MKPILHIVRNSGDAQAIEIIETQARDNAYGVTAVFLQDVISLPSIPNVRTCILTEDLEEKTILPDMDPHTELIGYEDLLNLVFSVESITVW